MTDTQELEDGWYWVRRYIDMRFGDNEWMAAQYVTEDGGFNSWQFTRVLSEGEVEIGPRLTPPEE